MRRAVPDGSRCSELLAPPLRARRPSGHHPAVPPEEPRLKLPQRERGPEWVVLLVSEAFDGVPWLERVYQAGSLWDRAEMGAPADVHCYTPAEFARRRERLRIVRETADRGLDL